MANCFYCGIKLVQFTFSRGANDGAVVPDNARTKEHIVPKSKGGIREPDNLVWSCRRCNNEKGSLSIGEYRAALAYRHGLLWMGQSERYSFWGERSIVNYAHSSIGVKAKRIWRRLKSQAKGFRMHPVKATQAVASKTIAQLWEIIEHNKKKQGKPK